MTVSDCLRRNSYASVILQVILQCCSRNNTLTSRQDDHNTLFMLTTLTTTTVPMSDIFVSSKPFPHPCNNVLGHQRHLSHAFGKAQPRASRSPIHLFGVRRRVLLLSWPCPMLPLNITNMYMKLHPNGTSFYIGITFPVYIKPGTAEKSISP